MTHSVTEPAADTIPTNLPGEQPPEATLFWGPHTTMNPAPAMGWPHAKLTPEQVVEIRPKHWSGVTLTQLAKQYGVAASTICAIVIGRTWKHLPVEGEVLHVPKRRNKLDAEKVTEIRRRIAAGERQTLIAAAFNVSPGAISSIRRGQTWKRSLEKHLVGASPVAPPSTELPRADFFTTVAPTPAETLTLTDTAPPMESKPVEPEPWDSAEEAAARAYCIELFGT